MEDNEYQKKINSCQSQINKLSSAKINTTELDTIKTELLNAILVINENNSSNLVDIIVEKLTDEVTNVETIKTLIVTSNSNIDSAIGNLKSQIASLKRQMDGES